MKTTELVNWCTEQGTSILVNLANVHSNMVIERRHRTLLEIMRGIMNYANAPEHLWEYAVTNANFIMNV